MKKITDEDIKKNIDSKMSNILLNENVFSINTSIYRIFKMNYFIKMLVNKKNVLVKPKLWDDPFENFIFRTGNFEVGAETQFTSNYVRERFYGQCWTVNSNETDALWRIYSPQKDGVLVKTTIDKLFSSIYNILDFRAYASYFIGKVEYYNEEEIIEYLKQGFKYYKLINNRWTATTLLIKRIEFSHENEIRLLFIEHRIKRAERNNIYSYSLNVNEVFDEVVFDPRINDNDFKKNEYFIRKYGFNGIIKKSMLYQIPNINARLID